MKSILILVLLSGVAIASDLRTVVVTPKTGPIVIYDNAQFMFSHSHTYYEICRDVQDSVCTGQLAVYKLSDIQDIHLE